MRGKIRERIIRVLLNDPEGKLTGYRVAKLSKASYPWTHEFLRQLEQLKLIKATRVLNYRKLLNHWLKVHKPPKHRDYFLQNPLSVIKKTKLSYALTTYQGENLVQSYLFPSRVDIYIKEKDFKDWHRLIAKHGLVGKGNVRLLFEDDHVFYNLMEVKGLKVVSTPQLILDLLKEGGVCKEAADLLLKGWNNV